MNEGGVIIIGILGLLVIGIALWFVATLKLFFGSRSNHIAAAKAQALALAEGGAQVVRGRVAIVSGRVRRLRPVSKAIAHVEIDGWSEMFEVIAYRWAISRGDRVDLAVMLSADGRLEALAHRNTTNKTSGIATAPSGAWFLILISMVFLWSVIVPLFCLAEAYRILWRQADIECAIRGLHEARAPEVSTGPRRAGPQTGRGPRNPQAR